MPTSFLPISVYFSMEQTDHNVDDFIEVEKSQKNARILYLVVLESNLRYHYHNNKMSNKQSLSNVLAMPNKISPRC